MKLHVYMYTKFDNTVYALHGIVDMLLLSQMLLSLVAPLSSVPSTESTSSAEQNNLSRSLEPDNASIAIPDGICIYSFVAKSNFIFLI